MTTTSKPSLDQESLLALRMVQSFQATVDEICWQTSESDRAKTRHIGFHLTIAAGKLARVEERHDHGVVDEAILDEVAADLLVYACQLATIRQRAIGDLYSQRVSMNLDRCIDNPG